MNYFCLWLLGRHTHKHTRLGEWWMRCIGNALAGNGVDGDRAEWLEWLRRVGVWMALSVGHSTAARPPDLSFHHRRPFNFHIVANASTLIKTNRRLFISSIFHRIENIVREFEIDEYERIKLMVWFGQGADSCYFDKSALKVREVRQQWFLYREKIDQFFVVGQAELVFWKLTPDRAESNAVWFCRVELTPYGLGWICSHRLRRPKFDAARFVAKRPDGPFR